MTAQLQDSAYCNLDVKHYRSYTESVEMGHGEVELITLLSAILPQHAHIIRNEEKPITVSANEKTVEK